jgi:hypothetical protein
MANIAIRSSHRIDLNIEYLWVKGRLAPELFFPVHPNIQQELNLPPKRARPVAEIVDKDYSPRITRSRFSTRKNTFDVGFEPGDQEHAADDGDQFVQVVPLEAVP